MNWTDKHYKAHSLRDFLMDSRDEIQDLLNRGYGHGNICRELKVNYYVLSDFIKEKGMIPWPELSDMERVTFVDFVKGRIKFDGKTRMIFKKSTIPHVILSAEEYVRYHLLLQQMQMANLSMDETFEMIEDLHPLLAKE